MKTDKITKSKLKNFIIHPLIILCIIYGGIINTSYAQPQPTFNVMVKNFLLGDTLGGHGNVLFFDINIRHTNYAASGPFELAGNQYFFNFNPAIANGGTLSYRIVPGSSQFTNPFMIPRNPGIVGSRLDLFANAFPGAGNGQIIDTTLPGIRVVKMRLGTTANTFDNVPLNLHLRDTLNGSPYTKIFVYIGTTNTEITNNGTYTIDSTYNTSYANDIAASSINSPPSTINLPTATIAPKASFRNAGTEHQLHIPVTFKITGPVSYISNKIIASLAPGATIQVNFDSTFNPIAGSYNVSAYSRLTTDSNRVNDTLKITLNVINNQATLTLTTLFEGYYQYGNPFIDTVSVYAVDTTGGFEIIDTAKSLLNANGVGTFNFTRVSNGSDYYIVVKSRKSIETWSAVCRRFTGGIMSYDFTSAIGQAYGNNQIIINGKACIRIGDLNQDGGIDGRDMQIIDNDAYHNITGNVVSDLNGDAIVNATDISIGNNNAILYQDKKKPVIRDAFPASINNQAATNTGIGGTVGNIMTVKVKIGYKGSPGTPNVNVPFIVALIKNLRMIQGALEFDIEQQILSQVNLPPNSISKELEFNFTPTSAGVGYSIWVWTALLDDTEEKNDEIFHKPFKINP